MANKTWPFTTPVNYVFDPTKIEIAGGLAKLREQPEGYIGLSGFWKFEDDYQDSSDQGKHGTPVGNPQFVIGKVDKGLNLNGANYVNIPDLGVSGEHTIGAWIKPTLAGVRTLIQLGGFMNFGMFNGQLCSTNAANQFRYNTGAAITLNAWNHVVLVNRTLFYVNAIPYTEGENSVWGHISNSRIGYGNSYSKFKGIIDEVFVYDRALELSEIQDIYNSGIPSAPSGLYPTDKPTIRPSDSWQSLGLIKLTRFVETLGGGNEGSIGYKLSGDNGMNWLFWNGASWAVAGDGDYNDAATIQTNIESFLIDSDKITFKAFLISDGTQKVELDKIKITAEKLSDILQIILGKLTNIKIETDKINSMKTMIELIEGVEVGEWEISNDVLYFKDPTGQNTIASFQLYYDNKGNVIRRERIS